jgi:hypothetical protein
MLWICSAWKFTESVGAFPGQLPPKDQLSLETKVKTAVGKVMCTALMQQIYSLLD